MSNVRSRVAVSRLPGDGAAPQRADSCQALTYQTSENHTNVWIDANVTVLAGVSVASGTVVAAAVVTKSIEQPHTIVAGVPAWFIKNRIQEPTP